MHLRFRLSRLVATLVPAALILAPLPAPAAPSPAADGEATPWLYRGSDVPQDKEWVFGELPNGLRYAVRRNGVPPGQVSIRIRMDVGSLYEQENEKGYSHLLEHLVFRQSKYLGDGQAIPTWQRLGATFGSDTNAQTGPISTTFKLDLPGVTPVSLDESFKLLSGMMIAPTLSEANVRTDVPIVLAEKRERGGTAERVSEASQATLFAGQKLAVRPVIGTVETLEHANQASVRAFHARWYRPENSVIVAVGDADPAMLAGLIKKYFGGWKAAGKHTPPPPFGDPKAPAGADPANPVGETKVLVEPDLPRGMSWAVMRPWRPVKDTIVYNQGNLTGAVGLAIINRRLEARARSGGSFLVAQVNQEKVSRSADATFVFVTPLDGNWGKAVDETRAVIADALATPPSQEEIDREVAEMSVAFESAVEQRRLLAGSRLADDMITALDINETIASPEVVQKIFNDSRALFTPEAVLEKSREMFRGSVVRGIYVTPKAGEADADALRAALARPVEADANARVDSKAISFAEMPPVGEPGTPKSEHDIGVLGIEQIEYANGVKVLLWPSADEPGRVTVKARFGNGYRAFGADDAAYITLGNMALVGSGVGSLGQDQLDRISTGRKMGFDFDIGDGAFTFSADTRQADMADQLYLFAAKFATPRWDAAPLLRAKAAARLQYESYSASPQGMIERDLSFYQRGGDPRYHTPTPAEIEAATPDGFRRVWQPILEEGPIEVQLFGDFDRASALAALNRTFGALPKRKPLPQVPAAQLRQQAASTIPVVLTHRGDPGQAAALVVWPTGGGTTQVPESRQLEILSQVLQNRLLDRLRERLGAAYSPQVANNWPYDLENGGQIMAIAQLRPADVPVFYQLVDEIAADLVAKPPSADELGRVTEPLRQLLTRASTSSAFFMNQLEGASSDPRRIAALGTMIPDYTRTTPEAMQALAARYLGKGSSWRLAVIPEGQKLAGSYGEGADAAAQH